MSVLPVPTAHARYAFWGCTVMLALGLAGTSPSAVILACSGFVGLSVAFALTMPLGARLRRQRLEFAWWFAHGDPDTLEGAVVPSAPFRVRCYIRHRGTKGIRLSDVHPVAPDSVRLTDEATFDLALAPRARTEFAFTLVSDACGRVVLQGLAVSVSGPGQLFMAPLYFPNPLTVKVLPRISVRTPSVAWTMTGLPVERSGLTLLRRHGGGTELHELREHQPGDPFKAIAWKATARTGKLMVREVEREVQETSYIILDISGSMRGGAPGQRKLDMALELAAAEAKRALDRGDRVGLMTVDGRLHSHVQPDEGLRQMIRVYDALIGATEVVDADLTAVDDDGVAALVARYLRQQEGVDVRQGGVWDRELVLSHVEPALQREGKDQDIVADSDAAAQLRRFCRIRGLPLPYRSDTPELAKGQGLARALGLAGRPRMPRSILVITDFDGMVSPQPLSKTLTLLRGHGHIISFVFPEATALVEAATSAVEEDVQRVYGMHEQRRIAEARSFLARYGVPMLVANSGDAPGAVIARLASLRRVS